jgi:glycosyltransferase involved in cell wall biosynthesis
LNPKVNHLAIFVATSGHSGVDRVITNLVKEFAARNLSIDLLHIENHGPYIQPESKNVRIINLGTSHVNTSLLPLLNYLRCVCPNAMLCDKDRVNRLALWAKKLAGVPTRIVIRIGTTVSKNLERRSPWARWSQYISMRCFYPWADAIIVPSYGAALDLSRITRLTQDRIKVVPSPVVSATLTQWAAEPVGHPWFAPDGLPVILGVGELCARKDFGTLIKAFAKVRQQRSSRLVILGEGRQQERLTNLVHNLGLESDVLFPGFVINPYAYMSKAAVFVLSSRCEGAPVVLMEALAVGVPVVSTDCPSGPREILQNGLLGPLVPVGDVDAMAQAIISTLDNPPAAPFLKSAAALYAVAASATQYLAALGFPG